MFHKKFGPDRFSRFDVYWIQTNRQTDKPNLYIDCLSDSEFVNILGQKVLVQVTAMEAIWI